MRMILMTAALALAAPAVAQTDKMAPAGGGEATIYRDPGFQGPALSSTGPIPQETVGRSVHLADVLCTRSIF